ncbi:MAG TPA: FmdE family protein [Blastocatellia bacterium]|nr:FmdE family protein [Blastocatellia bacterium]
MDTLEEYLVRAEKNHGHMCAGQVLGVRMAMLGCKLIGIDDPLGADQRRILVFVEIDRCAADAINTVTGCRLGKRTMKFQDFGKLAATFVNTATKQAARVVAVEDSREAADRRYPEIANKYQRQLHAYKELPDESLFKCERVEVDIPEQDQPGHPVSRVRCDECGEGVNDRREIIKDGRTLCRACAGYAYYRRV